MKRDRISLIIFIALALASGWIGAALDRLIPDQPPEETLGLALWISIPFLLPILLRLINRDWKNTGLDPHFRGNGWIYLIAILTFPITTAIALVLSKMLGALTVESSGWETYLSVAGGLLLSGFVKNILEEFAWRGYMTPKLMRFIRNDYVLYAVSGLIWGLWHVPYYLFFLPDKHFTEISRLHFALLAILITLLWSPFFTELYLTTRSVWPCVIAHMMVNAVPTALLMTGSFMAIRHPESLWLHPVTGILLNVGVLVLGLGLGIRRRRFGNKRMTPSTETVL